MNKKGFFITLTAALILLIVLITVMLSSANTRDMGEVSVQYVKHRELANHVRNMGRFYIPSLIRTSARSALINMSRYAAANGAFADLAGQLKHGMGSGYVDGDKADPAKLVNTLTLPDLVNQTFISTGAPINLTSFDFDVVGIEQRDPFTIRVTTNVRFTVESASVEGYESVDLSWSQDETYATDISVIGMTDPALDSTINCQWNPDTSKSCLLAEISGLGCSGVVGLCPLGGCP